MDTQICFMYFYGPRLNCFRPFLSNNLITWRLEEYSDTTQVGTLLTEFCEELVQADLLESYDSSSITGGSYSGSSYATINAVLKASSSESPDYTQILTNINNNLSNLVTQFDSNGDSNSCTFRGYIRQIVMSIIGYVSDSNSVGSSAHRGSSLSRKLNWEEVTSSNNSGTSTLNTILSNISSRIQNIYNMLRQSVSPNASITDVISALNATIDSKQNTTIVNNEVTPLAEINIDVPFEVKNLKKSDVENL